MTWLIYLLAVNILEHQQVFPCDGNQMPRTTAHVVLFDLPCRQVQESTPMGSFHHFKMTKILNVVSNVNCT